MIILNEQNIQGLGLSKSLQALKNLKNLARKAAPQRQNFIKRTATQAKNLIRKKTVVSQTANAPRPNFFTRAVRTVGGGIKELKTLLPAPPQDGFTPAELAEFQESPKSVAVVPVAVMPATPAPVVVPQAETMEQMVTASIEPVGEIKPVRAVAPIVKAPPAAPVNVQRVAPSAVLDPEQAAQAVGDLTPVEPVAPASQEMREAVMTNLVNTDTNAPNAPQPKNNTLVYAGIGVAAIVVVVLLNKKK